MTPMLNCYPERRVLSEKMLSHPWLFTSTPADYYMYRLIYPGPNNNTSKSSQSDTTWRSRRTRCTSMSRRTRTERSRTTAGMTSLTMSSSNMRRLETSGTSTAVSWTWATSGTGRAFSCRSWISDPTGSLTLDELNHIIALSN